MKYADTGPRTVTHFIIVESPQKAATLNAALKRARIGDAVVFSTDGPLYLEPSLQDLAGVDTLLNEGQRKPAKAGKAEGLTQRCRLAQRVWIATDTDLAGEALAADLAALLRSHSGVYRLRLRALDPTSVAGAFARPERTQEGAGRPHAARRLLERSVHAVLASGTAVPTNAAPARLLALCAALFAGGDHQVGVALLTLPAADDKDPYSAVLPVFVNNQESLADLVTRCEAFAEEGFTVDAGTVREVASPLPWNHTQAILETAQILQRPVTAVAQSMQRLYEAGRLSFPRTPTCALSSESLAIIADIANSRGARFDASRAAQFAGRDLLACESPRPATKQVELTSPLALLPLDEAVLALLTRHLITTGQPHFEQEAAPESLPLWSGQLRFSRTTCPWLRPWPKKPAQSSIRLFAPDYAVLHRLQACGLDGIPGAPGLAEAFGTQCLTSDLSLTPAMLTWLTTVPPALQDFGLARQIEAMLSPAPSGAENEPPAQLAHGLLDHLGLWQSVQEILRAQSTS